jgi:hypothetical protein
VSLILLNACSSVVFYQVNGLVADEQNKIEILNLALLEVKEVFNDIDRFVVVDCNNRKSEKVNEKTKYCKTVNGVKKPYWVNLRVYSEDKSIVLKYVSSGISKKKDEKMRNQISEVLSSKKYQVRIISRL